MTAHIEIIEAGLSSVTDLGRRDQGYLGIQTNGAADQRSARLANALVGNDEQAPVIEVLNMLPFAFQLAAPMLVSVVGAAGGVVVDDQEMAVGVPLILWPGAVVKISPSEAGLRTYIGIHGWIEGDEFLGSVAIDSLIGRGRRLVIGDSVRIDNGEIRMPNDFSSFLFGIPPTFFSNEWELEIVPGIDAHEFPDFLTQLPGAVFTVSNDSDNVGVRLEGPHFERSMSSEILSRGVPLGAIEAPPTGSLIILMRGRPLTAGYPIPAVVARSSHHLLGQLRPGDSIRLRNVSVGESVAAAQQFETQISQLRQRCATAFTACRLFKAVS